MTERREGSVPPMVRGARIQLARFLAGGICGGLASLVAGVGLVASSSIPGGQNAMAGMFIIDMLRTVVLLTTVAGALIGALSAAYSARIVSTLGTILVTGVGIFAVSDSAVTIHALFFANFSKLALK